MSSVLDTPESGSRSAGFAAIAGTVVIYAGLVGAAPSVGARHIAEVRRAVPALELVDVLLPAASEPLHETEPTPEPALSKPIAAPRPAREPAVEPPKEQPPSSAEAGQVLDSQSDVVDFGNIVVGQGEYAGGTTDAEGASKKAVRDPGNGFAREARRCAHSKRWVPALDRYGKHTAGVTWVNVRFRR